MVQYSLIKFWDPYEFQPWQVIAGGRVLIEYLIPLNFNPIFMLIKLNILRYFLVVCYGSEFEFLNIKIIGVCLNLKMLHL